ncbi:TIR domain-containing protein [Methanophagales archaeon]|nr:TIR domain-containing protein [Methanophagales archaeon]
MPSVFLSHSSDNKVAAREIKKILAAKNVRVWFDEDEMKPGDSIYSKINEGLQKIDFVAALFSKSSINSYWVEREIAAAFSIGVEKRELNIIPILMPDLDPKDIPPLLKDFVRIRFNGDYDEVVKEIMKGVVRNYKDKHNYTIEIIFPKFPASCELSWFDSETQNWLKNSTGVIGDISSKDKEHRINCTTNASEKCFTDLAVQVEGTADKIWPQASGNIVGNKFEGTLFLREGQHQETIFIVSIYEPYEKGSQLASRRLFKIKL